MGIENTVMETKEDIKIREILEKEEPLQKKKKAEPQFGLGQVPNYGKSRSGREYGGFIKDSVRKKMEFKPTNRGRKLNEKGPYDI
tara:strand:- start:231 stop:485 length:255 start_codon:yes stop_codon:yes gene_type:complete